MSEIQQIQWFPGHMTRTKRQIQASLGLVDAVAEIIDARVPQSSRNPDLNKLVAGKPRVVLLNKCDMADPNETTKWLAYFEKEQTAALTVDCKTGKGLNRFAPLMRQVLQEKLAQWKAKGMVNRGIRVMIVGIPNVGKSSFINRMAGGSRARVEDRPGVTRGNQWFSAGKGLELLDTPGVLWPKFDDPAVGEKLAFTGAIKDQIVDTEQLAGRLLCFLAKHYPAGLQARFKLTQEDLAMDEPYDLLCQVGRRRGMLISGGEVNTERAAATVLDEFRAGKLGRVTLDPMEGGR